MHNINYTLADTNKMTYEEFGGLVDVLHTKISEYLKDKGTTIDLVSPVLRTGGVLGSMLAAKLRILPMLPVQFKYSYSPVELTQIISVPDILQKIPDEPTILICEGNTSSGETAVNVIKLLKQKFPSSHLLYATVTQVYSEQVLELEGVDQIFYGVQTNENFSIGDQEAERLGLRKGITVFPWENAQEEIDDFNAIFTS
jgi:hypothetical protein